MEIQDNLQSVLEFKKANSFSVLLKNFYKKTIFDDELLNFLEMVNSLDYEEKPNYKALQD